MSEATEWETTVGRYAVLTVRQADGHFRAEVQKWEPGLWARLSRPVVTPARAEASTLHAELVRLLESDALPVEELFEVGVAREWVERVDPDAGAEHLTAFMHVLPETAKRLMGSLRARLGPDTAQLAIRREYTAITGGFGESRFYWEVYSVPAVRP
jgi:hypothetical protein